MTQKIRAYISYLFIFLFIVGSIVMCLYSAGYRLVLTWPLNPGDLLQKTGMLIVKTSPEEAKIKLEKNRSRKILKFNEGDGEIKRTPEKIKELLPGKYKLTLKKEGYWTWKEKIEIKPGQNLNLKKINLIKKTLPLIIHDTTPQKILANNDFEKILLTRDKKILDIEEESIEKTIQTNQDQSLENYTWPEDKNYLLSDQDFISLQETGTTSKISQKLGENVSNLKLQNDKLYYHSNNSLNYFDLKDYIDKEAFLQEKNILDYTLKQDKIYTLVEAKDHIKLNIYQQKTDNKLKTVKFPYSLNYKFLNLDNDYINIYNSNYRNLYLLKNKQIFNSIKSIDEVKNIVWMKEDQFVYANDFEIFLYNLDEDHKTLITRVSTPINKILWSKSENYLIYSTDKELNLIELKPDRYNKIINLVNFKYIRSPLLDTEEEVIYFTGQVGNSSGVYKLFLN